jgi:hypothetical protein
MFKDVQKCLQLTINLYPEKSTFYFGQGTLSVISKDQSANIKIIKNYTH